MAPQVRSSCGDSGGAVARRAVVGLLAVALLAGQLRVVVGVVGHLTHSLVGRGPCGVTYSSTPRGRFHPVPGSGQGHVRGRSGMTSQEVFDSHWQHPGTLTPQELLEGEMDDGRNRQRGGGEAARDRAPRTPAHPLPADGRGDERCRGGPRPRDHARQRVVPPAPPPRHRRAGGGERGEDPRRCGQALPLRRHPRARRPRQRGRRPGRLCPGQCRRGRAPALRRGEGAGLPRATWRRGSRSRPGTAPSTSSTRPPSCCTPRPGRPGLPSTIHVSFTSNAFTMAGGLTGEAVRWTPTKETTR